MGVVYPWLELQGTSLPCTPRNMLPCTLRPMLALQARKLEKMVYPVQNINHLAFKSMFKREKLSGNYFNDWFHQLKLDLRVENKMYVIEQPIPLAPAANVLAKWNAVYDAHNEVACLMLRSMTLELHRQLENSSPYEMLQELKSMFEKQAGVESDFTGFVRNYNMHNMRKTIGELHAMLIEYEKGLPKKAVIPQVMAIHGGKIQKANKKSQNAKGKGKGKGKGKDKSYVPKPKNPKPNAKENMEKNDACHHCKEFFRVLEELHGGRIQKANKKSQNAKGKDDESFDQCVSCLSGKMTRKSFPHHLERAIDLLGLIHTDVYGPLRHVSRQGASYFITFTNDYSCYGYIYLLKHKHKVFETFKVFKNEVENQLEKTIKALRSDRGGKYISQEFKDYLKAYGIVQQLTPPYTPQHNRVSERRNRTLLDMVGSMMNLTTLPLSFWDSRGCYMHSQYRSNQEG
uniref:Retrotransposon protein, putative, Ty1-copia subclass n=1 Tax=Tanacetum cinerariifolium TaxID=118510 RepID=A0A6L2MH95_TANCI|nr:retrotransposon protein, putative, Ty1-copia subclass [Tanacetum cinerariifolium]